MPTTYSDIKATSEFNARYRTGRPRPMATARLLASQSPAPLRPGESVVFLNDGTFHLAPFVADAPKL